jgi:hypothetical protein
MSFPKKPLELFTYTPEQLTTDQWKEILTSSYCQYLGKKCDKTRKSQPEVSIGTCTVGYMGNPVIICPRQFLQRRQVFLDTIHLLDSHSPGNQLHVIPEMAIPGGSVDYFVVSVQRGDIKDYLALEIQAMDTTGSVWPSRQKVINDEIGLSVEGVERDKGYAINWKMSAKTILIQMHHKVKTLELLGKKLVLVIQDVFFNYITEEFATSSLQKAETAHSAHFHIYEMTEQEGTGTLSIELVSRHSTTTLGIEQMLGLQADATVSEDSLLARLKAKISNRTLLTI